MGTVLGLNPKTVYAKSEGERFAGDAQLAVVNCATCGVTYAIPESFDRSARRYHGDEPSGWKICCPFGHTWWYVGETETEKLKRQLRSARDNSAYLTSRLDQTKASLRAQKGAATRARNERRRQLERIAAGVCPCCNRSFTNVRRHMASKHADVLERLGQEEAAAE
jgi:hypothetical protein